MTVADTRNAPALLATLRQELPDVKFVSGAFTPDLVQGSAVRAVYRSPGLAPAVIAPVVDAARAMGLPVGGELDLFSRALADLREVPATEVVEENPEPHEPVIEAPMSDAPDAAGSLEGEAALGADSSDVEEMPAPDAAEGAPALEDASEDAALPALPPLAAEQPAGYRPAVLAITGTNGKTTVTSLVGQLVQRAGKTVAVAGNIGPTLLDTLSAHLSLIHI